MHAAFILAGEISRLTKHCICSRSRRDVPDVVPLLSMEALSFTSECTTCRNLHARVLAMAVQQLLTARGVGVLTIFAEFAWAWWLGSRCSHSSARYGAIEQAIKQVISQRRNALEFLHGLIQSRRSQLQLRGGALLTGSVRQLRANPTFQLSQQ